MVSYKEINLKLSTANRPLRPHARKCLYLHYNSTVCRLMLLGDYFGVLNRVYLHQRNTYHISIYVRGTYALPAKIICKNKERHTARTIVSWPDPKQWVIVHTPDLMMTIRRSIYIISIITREVGKLKTYIPTCCIMDNWETLDKIYLTGIL